MDLLLALLIAAVWVAVPLGLWLPRRRKAVAGLAAAVAVLAIVAGLLSPSVRRLDVTHTFVAYKADAFDREAHAFVVHHASAAGWLWPLPFAGYALLWIGALWTLRQRPVGGLLLPWLAAWTAAAAWLAMQKLAAPAAVVQPFGADRLLFPAGLAAALLLAERGEQWFAVVARLCVAVFCARLPLALFSKVASDGGLGTSLDIHSITTFLVPISAEAEVETVQGSWVQQGWLIWGQHLLFMPAFYLMSLSGIAIAAYLFRRHGAAARQEMDAAARAAGDR